jgi:hypothetical protein
MGWAQNFPFYLFYTKSTHYPLFTLSLSLSLALALALALTRNLYLTL